MKKIKKKNRNKKKSINLSISKLLLLSAFGINIGINASIKKWEINPENQYKYTEEIREMDELIASRLLLILTKPESRNLLKEILNKNIEEITDEDLEQILININKLKYSNIIADSR